VKEAKVHLLEEGDIADLKINETNLFFDICLRRVLSISRKTFSMTACLFGNGTGMAVGAPSPDQVGRVSFLFSNFQPPTRAVAKETDDNTDFPKVTI